MSTCTSFLDDFHNDLSDLQTSCGKYEWRDLVERQLLSACVQSKNFRHFTPLLRATFRDYRVIGPKIVPFEVLLRRTVGTRQMALQVLKGFRFIIETTSSLDTRDFRTDTADRCSPQVPTPQIAEFGSQGCRPLRLPPEG
jgi:hypothetical protein